MTVAVAEGHIGVTDRFDGEAQLVLYQGDCLELLGSMPDGCVQLIVTSPPYNIGKEYERDKGGIDQYITEQTAVIKECERVLSEKGSICWQVGNYVSAGAIVPLDAVLYPLFAGLGLVLRNRVVWHFEHGLHCSRRFSGRYESILWFTRDRKDYVFNLDPVRVPQKYPNKKHFKGPKAGQYSCNPQGKNPGDVWDIPNVKHNHVEKTSHPCQFPVELVERLVLSMSNSGDLVLDPYLGSGTTVLAALMHGRKGAGAESNSDYADIARERVEHLGKGTLRTRPMNQPKYRPRA